ncbi:histidine phosphatase family protein [Patescibacteria group bacterium]|nr:histidine phosphatase family protein [Patescibacteria group bacterium]MBU1868314.1 histidine phosphatase family protein [Patescibacteria group bacterium]
MVKKEKKDWRKYWDRIYQAAIDSINHPGGSLKPLPKGESRKYPEIYLFRHGETYDNRRKIYCGHRDSKLTPKGVQQAHELRKKLKDKDINLCIISSLSRSIDTAKIALRDHLDVKYIVDDRMIERNYGELQGKSKEKTFREDTELAVVYRRGYDVAPPGGESIKMVEKRVFPFCEELVKRVKENNVNVAISGHGNSMRVIRAYFEDMGIVEELTHENPLGRDYAEYVVRW